MESALKEIIDALKAGETQLDSVWLDKLVRRRSRAEHDGTRRVAKRRLLPYYLKMKQENSSQLAAWGVDAAIDEQLVRLLRAKPRRTASGVATITVLTKPWPCSSDCLYCPNDVRMPKSYLTDEPACQRAERNYFDPYLQVQARLRVLEQMGHVTDKVELIVLGGTWSDYPKEYQIWFMTELFRALNEAGIDGTCSQAIDERNAFYCECGLTYDRNELEQLTAEIQREVTAGERTYNQVVHEFYRSGAWERAASVQCATLEDLEREHQANEDAAHRVVGLVIETRPDLITPAALTLMRQLGCTKVQMGIQSLDEKILSCNKRNISTKQIARAFRLLRLFGFKIHIHFMVNLLGATPVGDKADYLRLVREPEFLPDEVKLYPCCLVESSRLGHYYQAGEWQPYAEDVLVDVLMDDVLATPAYTRISRMIRDISSGDIVAGNKKTNLRQMVEQRVENRVAENAKLSVQEIRSREISTAEVDASSLVLDCVSYATAVSEERFLQWVTPENNIAGFLRLSLPSYKAAEQAGENLDDLPVKPGEAMIREVHVYGKVAGLQKTSTGVQHMGLGRHLVEEACRQARIAGFTRMNVISSVGTRNYYRSLGFEDNGLYQTKHL